VSLMVRAAADPSAGGQAAPSLARVAAVMSTGLRPWLEVVLIPLSSSVFYDVQWFVRSATMRDAIEVALGLAVGGVHLAFWWTLFRHRRTAGLAGAVACSLMLVTYASTAGLLLRRVPEFGAEYMRQPRYVNLYALSAIACLVWFAARLCSDPATPEGT